MTTERQHTILVVDDEDDIRLVLGDILGVRYRVIEARDGVEALEKIAVHPEIELVLTDLRMQRMDGMALLDRIEMDHPHLGVIMISAHGTVTDAVEAMQRGVFDYIAKPLPSDFREIYAKLDRFFRLQEMDDRAAQLQRELVDLSCFPRSNPNYLARAVLEDTDIALYPGNDKTADFLRRTSGAPAADGSFSYRQGQIADLFPADFPEILERIGGTDEVVSIDRVPFADRYYHHTYTTFVDHYGQIFINLVDITSQVENEQLRTMLEAGMEHEFKNILMSITPNAEMLHGGMFGPLNEAQKNALKLIVESGQTLLDSLTERLEFSRAYSGTLQLNRTEVDLYDMTRDICTPLVGAMPDREFRLEGRPIDLEATRPRGAAAPCDPTYIRRVIDNLLGNACKHAPWIDVRIRAADGAIHYEVADGGDGMDAEDCAGIWTLGYRAKNRKGRSTGIGLPYSKLIVEAHGGNIGVESAPGAGATFYFSLPTAAP